MKSSEDLRIDGIYGMSPPSSPRKGGKQES